MKRVCPCVFVCGLLFSPALSSPAEAGQTIIINRTVNEAVYGNGSLPYGAPPASADPNYNTVRIGTGGNAGWGVYGGDSAYLDVMGNKVILGGGATGSSIIGGNSLRGAAVGNRVTVRSGGSVTDSVYGGRSPYYGGGAVSLNVVTVSGDNTMISGDVYGGYGGGAADGNKATVKGGSIGGSVYGGMGDGKSAISGNSATVSGTETMVRRNVYGGAVAFGNVKATVTGNKATIKGGSIGESVYGGTGGGAVTGNSAALSGTWTMVAWDVYGGHGSGNGAVTGNSAAMSGDRTAVNGSVYGGQGSGGGKVAENSATIRGGLVNGSVYGGFTYGSGAATYNRVTVSGAGTVVNLGIFGGYAHGDGKVANNKVTINRAWSNNEVYGGYGYGYGAVSDNRVAVSGGFMSNVYGGHGKRDVIRNSVAIKSAVSGSVYGGYSDSGGYGDNTVGNNSASVSGSGAVNGSIYGGYVDGYVDGYIGGYIPDGGAATNNSASVSGSNMTVTGSVYGGYTPGDGAVSGNSATVSGGTIKGYVYGGYGSGNVAQNSVTVKGGTINNKVYGGLGTGTGTVANNNVTVSGGYIGSVFGGLTRGNGAVKDNSVTVSGGKVLRSIYGGYASGDGVLAGGGAVTGNSVTITGGKMQSGVYGGYTKGRGAVTGNSVNVSGAAIWDVFGGYIFNRYNVEGASQNTVTITGGRVKGTIYGGYTKGKGNAVNNTVILSGTPKLGMARIYGGRTSRYGDAFTGNRLVFNGFKGSVNSLKNFAAYDFFLPNSLKRGQTMVKITGVDAVSLNKTIVAITGVADGSTLKKGNSVTLINKVSGTPKLINSTNVAMSVTKVYDFDVSVKNGKLTAKVADVRANDDTQSVALGVQSGLVTLNRASDSLAATLAGTAASAKNNFGPMLFGNSSGQDMSSGFVAGFDGGMSGGMSAGTSSGSVAGFDGGRASGSVAGLAVWQRAGLDAGMSSGRASSAVSAAASDSFNVVTGVAFNSATGGGNLLTGSFAEIGKSGFNNAGGYSHLSSGLTDSEWKGGGLFSRFENANGFYIEGLFRSGRMEFNNDKQRFISSDVSTGMTYMAGHAGFGKVWQFTDELSLDTWTRSSWSRLEGSNVSLADDRLRFDSSQSVRAQAGARLTWKPEENITSYAGVSYEHEFDGRVKSSLRDVSVRTPSLSGDTGVAEVGLRFSPSKSVPLFLDLGVQTYVGKREDVCGSFQLKFEF